MYTNIGTDNQMLFGD